MFLTLKLASIDEDADGLSDIFEEDIGLDLQGAEGDDDLDSFSNLVEFYFGSNPVDASDFPQGLDFSSLISDDILRIGTRPGIVYQLQRLDFTLQPQGEWVGAGGLLFAGDTELTFEWTQSDLFDSALFRAVAFEPVDGDGDGLDLWEETYLGLDDTDSDFDDDGVSDGDEIINGTDPSTPDGDLDTDTDGDSVPDILEASFGLDPLVPELEADPDNDGFLNRWEVAFGTNGGLDTSRPQRGDPNYAVVDQSLLVPGSFATIQEAVTAVGDLGVIEVLPGIYEGDPGVNPGLAAAIGGDGLPLFDAVLKIPFDQRLTVFAPFGAEQTIIREPEFGFGSIQPAFIESASRIFGFRFEGEASGAIVFNENSEFEVYFGACVFSGENDFFGTGLFVEKSGAGVVLERCTSSFHSGAGVNLVEGETLTIRGCVFVDNGGGLVSVAPAFPDPIPDAESFVSVEQSLVDVPILSGTFGQLVIDNRGNNFTATTVNEAGVTPMGSLLAPSPARGLASGIQVPLVMDFQGEDLNGDLNQDAGADEFLDVDGDTIPDWAEAIITGDATDVASVNLGDDFDGDGLGDYGEILAGTDPTLFDSDFDGLGDGVETSGGTDPLVPDYEVDSDQDGYLNIWERVHGTDAADGSDFPVYQSTALPSSNGVSLSSNLWRSLPLPNPLTIETGLTLEFEFRVPLPGEFHAIGLDGDGVYANGGAAAIYSLVPTDSVVPVDFERGFENAEARDGQWRSYTIPLDSSLALGDVLTRLVLIQDWDQPGERISPESFFRNVRVTGGSSGELVLDFAELNDEPYEREGASFFDEARDQNPVFGLSSLLRTGDSAGYFLVDPAQSEPGSFAEVGQAIAAAGSYGVIEVGAGLYDEGLLTLPNTKRLHLWAREGAAQTTLSAGDSNALCIQSASLVEGFTLINSSGPCVRVSNRQPREFVSRIAHCLITAPASDRFADNGYGIFIDDNAGQILIHRCTIMDCEEFGVFTDQIFNIVISSSILVENGAGAIGVQTQFNYQSYSVRQSLLGMDSLSVFVNENIGNIFSQTRITVGLRPDGALLADSLARGFGAAQPTSLVPDLHGEENLFDGSPDAGVDEFVDSDGDELPDFFEEFVSGNSTISLNPSDDSEGDGLNNLAEYENGTSPFLADTDGDGVSDEVEVELGSDPLGVDLNARPIDRDGDGFFDNWEIAAGSDFTDAESRPSFDNEGSNYFRVDPNLAVETEREKRTIAAAIAAASNFALIEIRPGVYNERLSIPDDKRVHLFSTSGAGVTRIEANTSFFPAVTSQSATIISGLDIRSERGVGIQAESFLHLSSCIVSQNGSAGIRLREEGTEGEFLHCTIVANNGRGIDADRTLGIPVFIDNCILADNLGDFDLVASDESEISGSLIRPSRRLTAVTLQDSLELPEDQELGLRGDYRLLSNSPARGLAVNALGLDLDGEPFQDDAGVDEFVDSDGDELPDAFEELVSGDSTVSLLPTDDSDEDGLNNLAEYTNETSPFLADTDGDGLSDEVEVRLGLDPLEVNSGLIDRDRDGFFDEWEMAAGSDIEDAQSRPNFENGGANYFLVDPDLETETDRQKQTIGAAISAASDLALIEIEPGVYREHLVVPAGKRVHLFSNGGADLTRIELNFLSNPAIDSQSATIVSGLSIRNENGIGVDSESFLHLNGCIVSGNGASGIRLSREAAGEFLHCTIAANGGRGIETIRFFGSSFDIPVSIQSCILADNRGDSDLATFSESEVVGSVIRSSRLPSDTSIVDSLDLPIGQGLGLRSDYRLLPDSPARGVRSNPVGFDLDGEPFQDDAGVDEFVDSDDDGLSDLFENLISGDSTISVSPTDDFDGDGLLNQEEYLNRTSPILADTDGDGLSDSSELANNLDPLIPNLHVDLDNDGFFGEWESAFGTDGIDAESFPSFEDGFSNYFRVNPNLAEETDQEKKTISSAIEAAQDLAVIEVLPGNYDEPIVIPASKRIYLFSSKGSGVTSLVANQRESGILVNSDSIVSGFRITNEIGFGIGFFSNAFARLSGCLLVGSSSGVRTRGGPGNRIEISHCTIVNNSSLGVTTLETSTSDLVISDSIVVDNGPFFDVARGTPPRTQILIERSVLREGRVSEGIEVVDSVFLPSDQEVGLNLAYRLLASSPARGIAEIIGGKDIDGEHFINDAGVDEFVDTDDDGLPDVFEILVSGSSVISVSPTGDFDGDGLLNEEEYLNATSPILVDTDGDGLNDSFELANSSDPLVPDLNMDLDDDGFFGEWELAFGTGIDDSQSFPRFEDNLPNYFRVDPNLGVESVREKRTIQAAINAAQDLAIIEVLPGVYDESISTLGKRIHLFSTEGAGVTKLLGNNRNSGVSIANNAIMSGFQVTNLMGSGITFSDVDLAHLSNCLIVGNGGQGILINNPNFDRKTNEIGITHCTVVDNDGEGIYVDGSRTDTVIVEDSIFANNGGDYDVTPGLFSIAEIRVERSLLREGRVESEVELVDSVLLDSSDEIGLNLVYRLLQSSPARGIAQQTAGKDIDGESFLDDAGVDEYVDVDSDGLPDVFEIIISGDSITSVLPDEDSDRDGLSNGEEYISGTSPILTDSDGDGLSDFFELTNNIDPLVPNLDLDGDNDGVFGFWEQAFGTDAGDPQSLPRFEDELPNYFRVNPNIAVETNREKRTIMEAIDVAQDLAIIEVLPGAYNESVTVPANKRIYLFSSEGAGVTHLVGDQDFFGVEIRSSSVVSGFQITNQHQSGSGVGFIEGDFVRLLGCLIVENRVNGVFNAGIAHAEITHCTIVNNGSEGIRGSGFSRRELIVKDSIVVNNGRDFDISFFSGLDIRVERSLVREERLNLAVEVVDSILLSPEQEPGFTPLYRLLESSPARGIARPTARKDIDGEFFLDDAGVDEFIDADGDEIPDAFEGLVTGGSSLTSVLPTDDFDGDELSVRDEYRNGTSPFLIDTDNDGLSDSFELANSFDPLVQNLNVDVDNDGFFGEWEVVFGTDAVDSQSFPQFQDNAPNYFRVNPDLVVETVREKRTIGAAIDAAQDLAIIEVAPGVYNESVTVPANKRIYLFSSEGAGVTHLVGDQDFFGVGVRNGAVISGFTITNRNGSGVVVFTRNFVHLSGCLIVENERCGVFCSGVLRNRNQVEIFHCTIVNNSEEGIRDNNQFGIDLVVSDSILVDNGEGFDVDRGFASNTDIRIERSLVRDGRLDLGVEVSDSVVLALGEDAGYTASYRLLESSLARGIAQGVGGKDIDGEVFLDDAGVDEYIDTDGDGLPDSFENQSSSLNINLADSDGDGVLDVNEDDDGDQVRNFEEYLQGFSPAEFDFSSVITLEGGQQTRSVSSQQGFGTLEIDGLAEYTYQFRLFSLEAISDSEGVTVDYASRLIEERGFTLPGGSNLVEVESLFPMISNRTGRFLTLEVEVTSFSGVSETINSSGSWSQLVNNRFSDLIVATPRHSAGTRRLFEDDAQNEAYKIPLNKRPQAFICDRVVQAFAPGFNRTFSSNGEGLVFDSGDGEGEVFWIPMFDDGTLFSENRLPLTFGNDSFLLGRDTGYFFEGVELPPLTWVLRNNELRISDYSVESYQVTSWAGEVAQLLLETSKDALVDVDLYDPAGLFLQKMHFRNEAGELIELDDYRLSGKTLHELELVSGEVNNSGSGPEVRIFDESVLGAAANDGYDQVFRVKITARDVDDPSVERFRWAVLQILDDGNSGGVFE